MKPSSTTDHAGTSSTSQRGAAPRALLVGAGIIVVLVGGLVAVFEFGALGRSEPAAPDREVSTERVASPAARTPVPQPALPRAAPGNAAVVERPSARAENKLVFTQIKAQKYVEEAYPAWLKAHPGKDCPRKLIELNEYMDDKDVNDAWGRPMRMTCGADLPSGAKGFKVVSYGRDGERSEDDIKFGE
jgi:hypothetical protein